MVSNEAAVNVFSHYFATLNENASHTNCSMPAVELQRNFTERK